MSRLTAYPVNKDKSKNRVIDLAYLNDPNISWRQKGILTYLLSRPPGWELRIKDIQRRSAIGRNTLYDDLNNLIRKKYVHRVVECGHGMITSWSYFVFPFSAKVKKEDLESPLPRNRELANSFDISSNSEQLSSNGESPVPRFPQVEIRDAYKNRDIYYSEDESSEGKSDDSSNDKKRRTLQFMKKATKLAKIVQSQKNVKTNPTKLNSWANEMRLLNEQEGVSKHRMTAALKWYRDHVGGQYVPVVESGKSFRDKFVKIEAAMQRDGVQINQDETNKPKIRIRVGH